MSRTEHSIKLTVVTLSALPPLDIIELNILIGSGIRAHRQPDSGRECAAEPTLAVVALLHTKRMAAISAVEGHLIERVNGRFGPEAPVVDRPEDAFGLSVCNATVNGPRGCGCTMSA